MGICARRMSISGSKAVSAKVVLLVERRRRGKNAELLAAFRHQAIDEIGIQTLRREDRFRDPLRRVLIEVEAGRSKTKVEIDDDRRHVEIAGDGPGNIVGDGGGADAALGARHRDHAAKRRGGADAV